MYMYMEVMICQSEKSPEMFMTSETPSIGGHQNTSNGRRNVEETLLLFGVNLAKPFLLKIEYYKPSKIIEI